MSDVASSIGRMAVLAALAPLLALCPRAGGLPPPGGGFEVTFQRVLPAPVRWAFDVRWLSEDSIAVSAGRSGVFELSLADRDAPPRLIAGSERLTYAGPLAVSESYLATVFPVGVLAWRQRDRAEAWREDAPMAVVLDFDVSADRALFLGARRVEEPGGSRRRWAPEGGILFRSVLSEDPSALTLLMTARSGAGGKAMEMALCWNLEPGAVRFLPDGRYAVIPGVQPGVFVYAADGSLLRAWSSSSLGIYDECEIGEMEKERVASDPDARIAWWQRHTVLDDLVPWGEWFAALVRTPRDGGARWRFHPFGADGPLSAVELPIDGGSRGLHVRADSRGDRLAVLLFDYEQGETVERPEHRPRLLVLERTNE